MSADQDERIARLKTPEECEQFARNVEARGKRALAIAARRKALMLKAEQCASIFGAKTPAEYDALESLFAYEDALRLEHEGRNVKAGYTRRMFRERGIIEAVNRVVSDRKESAGYTTLVEMGMKDKLFEAVVLRHPEVFSAVAVERSRERLRELTKLSDQTAR